VVRSQKILLGWALLEQESATVRLAMRDAMHCVQQIKQDNPVAKLITAASWWQDDLDDPLSEWMLAEACFDLLCQQIRKIVVSEVVCPGNSFCASLGFIPSLMRQRRTIRNEKGLDGLYWGGKIPIPKTISLVRLSSLNPDQSYLLAHSTMKKTISVL